ncbi:MAG: phosphatase PAP2 family protein, partial [Candidatus Daviesbacteria bacterium]|nr:phosphatase PAP2 family protein [Candidatus Daviesbacteria bacterium]
PLPLWEQSFSYLIFFPMDNIMIFGAEYVIYLTIILVFTLAFKSGPKEKKALILAVFAIPVAIILIKIIHLFILTPRPFGAYETGASFPSRHTSIMAVFTFSYVFLKSKWAIFFVVLTLWVGIARVYVGVHYPIDILGGVIVGFLSVISAKIILKFFQKRFFL